MKRDMDLVRNILLAVEERDTSSGAYLDLSDLSDNSSELTQHLFLMAEVGFIEGQDCSSIGNREFAVTQLTWAGHEFLECIKDPDIWEKTKSIATKAGGFTISFLFDIAKGVVKTKLEQHTGVTL